MMLDWLYGKPRSANYGVQLIRCLVLDHDTVKDVVRICRTEFPDASLGYERRDPADDALAVPAIRVSVGDDELDTLSDYEITRLSVYADRTSGSSLVSLAAEVQPYITNMSDQLVNRVAQFMLANGSPRVRFRRAEVIPALVPVAAFGALVWFIVASNPPASLAILGVLLMFPTIVAAASVVPKIREATQTSLWVGHRIRRISRKQLHAERANRRADLKLAAITIPVGAILGALATALLA